MAIILLVTYLFLPQWNHMVIWGSPYLNTLSEVAAARGPAVTAGAFLAGAHRELSAALLQCQGSVYRGCNNLKAAGRQVLPGAVPYED